MPDASSLLEIQPLSYANSRVPIRDLPNIPAYQFSRAMGFYQPGNPRQNIRADIIDLGVRVFTLLLL